MRRLASKVREELSISLPHNIKAMREECGLSQSGLAAKMPSHVSQATISNWENGKTEVGFIEFITVCISCGQNPIAYISETFFENRNEL